LLPRPVYVLAIGSDTHGEVEAGATYTLRVRMAQKGASNDIAKVGRCTVHGWVRLGSHSAVCFQTCRYGFFCLELAPVRVEVRHKRPLRAF
jgi:hypothetical protein